MSSGCAGDVIDFTAQLFGLKSREAASGGDKKHPLSVGQDRDMQKKRRRGHSSTPSYSKNCAAVIHFGCSMSRLKKSLSPVRIASRSETMAAFLRSQRTISWFWAI